jgi:hypothetical protein
MYPATEFALSTYSRKFWNTPAPVTGNFWPSVAIFDQLAVIAWVLIDFSQNRAGG